MNPYRMQSAPQWWSPKLTPTLIRLLKPLRHRRARQEQQLLQIEVVGTEALRRSLQDGHGILITPNHPTHADAYAIYAASDQLETPFYIMAAWQVFDAKTWLGQMVLRWHGCFSVDREATDLQAFRQAVEILEEQPYPLVVFPEGEVYHCNERVTPFREGPAVMAVSASKRAKRPIAVVPCALKYEYIDDPTPELIELMDELEMQLFWRPRRHQPLHERIYRFAEAALSLKELEFLGKAGTGTLPERLHRLATFVLQELEERHQVTPLPGANVPERVKELRRRVIELLEKKPEGETERRLREDLDDLFFVVQLFSYPGDYVAERPSIERMAETLDKFEEDILRRYSASVRGTRRATVLFGEPVVLEPGRRRKEAARELTDTLEQRVQELLNVASSRTSPLPVPLATS